MFRSVVASIILLFGLFAGQGFAVTPDEVLKDPALEARARVLSAELRCMVCQNQSIDDSDAPLAKDLRVLVRERLVAGDTDSEVIDYLVSRYGEFVLLKPRFAWHTMVLWAAGPFALIAGLIAIFLALRRRVADDERITQTPQVRLSGDEEQKLKSLLEDADKT
jgi:cytochrome c-type biogenesis protein CcmH